MSLAKTLLPRSILVSETYNKLTGIEQDIQNVWQARVATIAGSYDIDKLNEENLLQLMASFDLLKLYNSLPPYYQGSKVNSDNVLYNTPALDRVAFMRKFLRELLRMRTQQGTITVFDSIMGLLKTPKSKFTVLQTFRYGSNYTDWQPSHANDPVGHPEWDVLLDRVIYSGAHILGLYSPAPCYRFFGPKAINISGTYIAFHNTIPATITRSIGSFSDDGFVGEEDIQIVGSLSNDGTYTILTVAATTLTLVNADSLVDEAAGNTVTIKFDPIIPGKVNEQKYDPLPETHEVFFPIGGKRYSPTQTITVDVFTPIPNDIESDFIVAARLLFNFLKPDHVIFKDIIPSVYLFTDYFYQMSLSLKGSYVTPQDTAPDFRIDFSDTATIDNATKRINFSSVNPVGKGLRPGMLISVYGFSNGANNVQLVQIDAIGNTYIHLNTTAILVTETHAGIQFHGDYDHSFQGGLIPDGVSVTKTNVFSIVTSIIFRNDAGGAGSPPGFDYDGFRVGGLLLITGFTNDVNNVSQVSSAVITDVGHDYIATTYLGFVTEAAAGQTVTIKQIENYDMANPDTNVPKPFIEERSDTLHSVIHQPGPVPTVASNGSYNARSATERMDILDDSRYDVLGSKIGGMIWFGDIFPPADFMNHIVTDGLGGNLLVSDGFGFGDN